MKNKPMRRLSIFLMIVVIMTMTATVSSAAPEGGGGVRRLGAVFTAEAVAVDGIADDAYAAAEQSVIGNVKHGTMPADRAGEADTSGILRAVWDGRTLYLLVDVTDGTPAYNGSYAGRSKAEAVGDGVLNGPAPGNAGGHNAWVRAGSYAKGDAVEFSVDFWNDKVAKFQDDDGLFSVTRDGYLTYFADGGVYNHSSVYAQKENREYNNRIGAWAAREKADGSGYVVELALVLYARDYDYDRDGYLKGHECPIENGNTYGVDVMIGDSAADNADRSARVYWSHNDNSLPFSSKDYNADWGEITLTGWNGEAFAFCGWSLTNEIRYVESDAFQKGVWSGATQKALDEALAHAKATAGSADQAAADEAADRLYAAVDGLRWADTAYPDPLELKASFTLPDPYRFLDGTEVKTAADWERRREEILGMAQFYEYGYKPAPPDKLSVDGVNFTKEKVFSWATWKMEDISYYKVAVTATYGSVSASTYFRLQLPSKEQLAAAGREGPLPVVIGFEAAADEYLKAGYAVLTILAGDITDDRNDPWSYRTGFIRNFFPYDRRSTREIGNEMAAAWECSLAVDALETVAAKKMPLSGYGAADTYIDPGRLAVTGFSICGKYAFVSAVFDTRIDVCIPSAGGCTGPSVYRFVQTGKEPMTWSWGQSNGSEVLGDTIRHNPGRTVGLFRRFLTPGHFYKTFEGAGGYGERLPYDHEELVATLAPRALVLQSTVDDYADQSVGDALSLTVAKTIYKNLGCDQDMLLLYNFRDGTNHGPSYHGEDAGQRGRTAEYLDWYFYGEAIPEATLKRLQTDPFLNDVIGGEDGYTRNFGGLKAIAPWIDTVRPDMSAGLAASAAGPGGTDGASEPGRAPWVIPAAAAAVVICAGVAAALARRKRGTAE